MKICNVCYKEKPLHEFYSQNKYSQKRGSYIYYIPECKECKKKISLQWRVDNREDWLKSNNKTNKRPDRILAMNESKRKYKDDGKQLAWQQKNKDKVKQYQEERKNMIHEITDIEWLKCKEYFNTACAYCDISESEHLRTYNEQLQKDHVDPNGSNKIDNCIPACKKCNPSKSDKSLTDWYNQNNSRFTQTRMDKIIYWLENYKAIISDMSV